VLNAIIVRFGPEATELISPVKTVIRNGAREWLLINMQQDRGSAGENA
jgi:hypothetical protein